MRIRTQRREGELGHLRLADNDGTRSPQPLHDLGIFNGRCQTTQNSRPGARDCAGDVEQRLYRNDAAIERTAGRSGGDATIRRLGLPPGAVCKHSREDVLSFRRLDARNCPLEPRDGGRLRSILHC